MSSKRKWLMVPLPAGDSAVQPELKLPNTSSSPIIDPHISPDGTMLAYVRDNELHVLNLLYNISKQLTLGGRENAITDFCRSCSLLLQSKCLQIPVFVPVCNYSFPEITEIHVLATSKSSS